MTKHAHRLEYQLRESGAAIDLRFFTCGLQSTYDMTDDVRALWLSNIHELDVNNTFSMRYNTCSIFRFHIIS